LRGQPDAAQQAFSRAETAAGRYSAWRVWLVG
jgi:hypothetical protein